MDVEAIANKIDRIRLRIAFFIMPSWALRQTCASLDLMLSHLRKEAGIE